MRKMACLDMAGWTLALVFALMAGRAQAQASLTYSGTNIQERWQNDGGFNAAQNFLTVTLTGAVFTNGSDFIAGGQVTAVNVPYGLTPVATRTATNTVTVSLAGQSGTNGPGATTNGLLFVFNDSAFSNYPAASVSGAGGSNLTVTFLADATNWYVNGSTGLDSNSGLTPGAAFKTISNALARAQSGANDVISIAAGTYTQAVPITIAKIVTFRGEDPATTIIQPMTNGTQLFTYSGALRHSLYQNLTLRNGGNAISKGINTVQDTVVSNCWFYNNTGTKGGAIYQFNNSGSRGYAVQLYSCIFSNNTASDTGGAVCSEGILGIADNCVFVGNVAATNGGAVLANVDFSLVNTVFSANAATSGSGGAYYAGLGRLSVDRCLFAGNRAGGGNGGAVRGWYVSITNSTLYGNTATNGQGGAIYASGNVQKHDIYNSTIVNNTATNIGGASYTFNAVTIVSSIVAGNTATVVTTAPDLYVYASVSPAVTNSILGVYAGSGQTAFGLPNASGNYVGNTSTNAEAGVLPLADNGGRMPTCALAPDSVAIDHGTNVLNLAWDQRGPGYARVINGKCDIGAFEFGAGAPRGTTLMVR